MVYFTIVLGFWYRFPLHHNWHQLFEVLGFKGGCCYYHSPGDWVDVYLTPCVPEALRMRTHNHDTAIPLFSPPEMDRKSIWRVQWAYDVFIVLFCHLHMPVYPAVQTFGIDSHELNRFQFSSLFLRTPEPIPIALKLIGTKLNLELVNCELNWTELHTQ